MQWHFGRKLLNSLDVASFNGPVIFLGITEENDFDGCLFNSTQDLTWLTAVFKTNEGYLIAAIWISFHS